MDKRLREFALALALYPALWVQGFYLQSGFPPADWWLRWTLRLLFIGAGVLLLLWFLDLKRAARGALYVIGMFGGSFLAQTWASRRALADPQIGWKFFLASVWQITPIHLASAFMVLGVLWGLRRWTAQ